MQKAEFIVLQEIFPSETSEFADVLLPGVTWAEKNGTFTNTERRVQADPPRLSMRLERLITIGPSQLNWPNIFCSWKVANPLVHRRIGNTLQQRK